MVEKGFWIFLDLILVGRELKERLVISGRNEEGLVNLEDIFLLFFGNICWEFGVWKVVVFDVLVICLVLCIISGLLNDKVFENVEEFLGINL